MASLLEFVNGDFPFWVWLFGGSILNGRQCGASRTF